MSTNFHTQNDSETYSMNCHGNPLLTLGDLAQVVTGGNLVAMARLVNDVKAGLQIDETMPDPEAVVPRYVLADLAATRAGDRVGRLVANMLRKR